MPFVERRGARVHFVDSGGRGAAVVLSHGLLMDHEMFEPQVRGLGDEFRCIVWDQRGHGDTTSDGSFTYWDSAEDLLALMDHLDLDRAFLVGMSQGGFVSLRVALLAPERVQGLAFIDSQAGVEDPDKEAVYSAMAAAWEQQPTRELAEAAAAVIVDPADREPWIEKWMARPPEAIREPFKTLVSREDLRDRLPEVTCPSLVIHGTADPAIPMEKAEELASRLPHCEGLVRIEGGGHAANLTHPGVVTEALRDFFRRHSA